MGTRVTLGGIPLTMGTGQVWTLGYGTAPYQRTFFMSRARAQRILAINGPIELKISPSGFKPLTVKNLYAIKAAPGDENNMGVVVVDVRWLLSRQAITRDYNVRRTTGEFRRVGDSLQSIQIQNVIADVIYRRSSLKNNSTVWTAAEILSDILGELLGTAGFRIESTKLQRTIEGLVLDKDRGDAALARALSAIPGARIFADTDGVVVVTDSLDLSEAESVKLAGPRYRSLPGQLELIDHSKIRPEISVIQFEAEPEFRFDYDEDAAPTLQSTPARPTLSLDNVIPVVDPTIVYTNAAGAARTVVEGTYLTVDEWLRAVNSRAAESGVGEAGALPKGMPALSMDIIRSQILSGFQHLRTKYTLAHVGLPDVLWDRRISALSGHFRRTFRINPKWADLLREIKDVRSSIVDQERQTRAKAAVYTDFFLKPSRRTLAKNFRTDNVSLGRNVEGYSSNVATSKIAPADVQILDPSAGIFKLLWRTDPWGDDIKIIPGNVDKGSISGVAMSNASLLDSDRIRLNNGWKLSVVMSARTASPNNSNRLYSVSITTDQAYAKLGITKTIPKSLGPKWTVGIGPGVETARFAWLDSESANIKNAVFQIPFIPSIDGSAPEISSSWSALKGKLLTNQETTDALALAMAANIHSLLVDRWEGSQMVAFNPDIKPTGSMAQVSHAILGSGAAITQMSMPPILQSIDIYALLPDGARKILQGLVQQ